MIIIYRDNNECDFGFNILRKRDIEKAKELILEGINAWYEATEVEPESTENFTGEEIKDFYYLGYEEPTMYLLEKYKIKYREIEIEKINEKDINIIL